MYSYLHRSLQPWLYVLIVPTTTRGAALLLLQMVFQCTHMHPPTPRLDARRTSCPTHHSPFTHPINNSVLLLSHDRPTTAGAWKDPQFALENKGKISVRPEFRPNKPGCLQSIGDACFHCGDAIMSRLPERVQGFFSDVAPPAVANIDGGVEMVFFMLVLLQMGLATAFLYYFVTNMQCGFP